MRQEDLDLLRKALWPLSMVYGLAVLLRNAMYDLGPAAVHKVDVPVISVGNLAAGGTGKTPLVSWLVQRAIAAGLRPGVLARGYGRESGATLNDEGRLLARRFPDLCQVQDPDRVRGARRLVADMNVDLIILDDGFQHRRLHRDLDLVCLDFARPFAGGLLPVGYLREPPRSLRRAHGLVFTRAGGFHDGAVTERKESLAHYCPEAVPMFVSDHVASRLVSMPDGQDLALATLRGARVLLLSAIARPGSFEDLTRELGAEVVGHERRRDHHIHTREELLAVGRRAEQSGARLLTTEKDEAKLAAIDTPRLVLQVELQFVGSAPADEWWSAGALRAKK